MLSAIQRKKLIIFFLYSVVFCSCGYGKFEVSIDGNQTNGWITIENIPENNETNCNNLYLSGKAFISPNWSKCCSYDGKDSGVTVTCKNLTTKSTGSVIQSVEICYFLGSPYLCNHSWSCDIPLTLGDNEIIVTAIDPQGLKGEKTIIVKKSLNTYSVTGKITILNGNGLWNYGLSGFKLTLIGTDTNIDTFTDKEGNYNFSCIANGSYKIIPSSPIEFVFSPPERDVNMNGYDIVSQNFNTEAYIVSGKVTDTSSGLAGVNVILESKNKNKLTYLTDSDGTYYFFVPNGAYDITASYCDFVQCYSLSPSTIHVTVESNNINNLNFFKQ